MVHKYHYAIGNDFDVEKENEGFSRNSLMNTTSYDEISFLYTNFMVKINCLQFVYFIDFSLDPDPRVLMEGDFARIISHLAIFKYGGLY